MSTSTIRPSSVITTFYGTCVRHLGGWMAVTDLITLMAELDIESTAVHQAVTRLRKRDVLVEEQRQDTGYRLSPVMDPIFEEGDRRIFGHDAPARLEDGWVMAVSSMSQSQGARRGRLRSRLLELGFGSIAPDAWLAPAQRLEGTRRILQRLDLSEYVHLFTADYAAFGDLRVVTTDWWDMPAIGEQYAAFANAYRPVLDELRGQGRPDPAQAFRFYVPMLTRWRRLRYLDPGLPAKLLPDDWTGAVARRVFLELDGLLAEPSRRHVEGVPSGFSRAAPR
ncbi:PaaX family transcriptional regulator C-terminal domain-containing protein [Streptomyces fulvoviolaceus]|uniref:PaaX family transcriptional regulator n=1 Tax=Streptomyces fulvoviolaceus TaxID=285535 RepID=UPI0004C7001D|nr:PaaX family transcriptional regulator C-terminal domain-containing protein [Streptomyces fulvoviolaceus]